FHSGGLFVSNPLINAGTAKLTLTAVSANKFLVLDGGHSLGTYNVGRKIYIAGSNGNDDITIDLNGQDYTGDLLVNSGNGTDMVSVTGNQTGTGTGSIGGNVSLLHGPGNAAVNL